MSSVNSSFSIKNPSILKRVKKNKIKASKRQNNTVLRVNEHCLLPSVLVCE